MSSSIHIQKASGGSVHHNSRENFSHSVVFTDEKNEVWNNAKDSFTIYRDELKIRSEAYSNSTGQKLQSRAVTQLSAVVNLEQHHTLKDLIPIQKYLEENFDTKVYQMAIHRDEGKLKEKATGNYLVSGTDFFLNPKDNKHYFDKKYTKPLNLENYTIEKNYHAHIEMMGLKSNGKAIRQDMNKFKLSKLQDFVAESLQMERGKNYRIEKSSKRLDTHDYKKQAKIINETKKELNKELASSKDLQEINKQLREELKEMGATRADYAQLEALNKELQARVKDKDLTIQELEKKIKMYETTFRKIAPGAQSTNEVIQHIAHNESETAQKLQEKQKTINTLINQKADVVATNMALKEHIAELTRTIAVKNKARETDGKQKKSFLDFFKAPENADFWGFLRQKVSSWLKEIRELKAENQALKDKINLLKAENQSKQKPTYEHEYERIQAKVRAEQAKVRAEQDKPIVITKEDLRRAEELHQKMMARDSSRQLER